MVRTPLVFPNDYFARSDAFSPWKAVGPIIVYWLASIAISMVMRYTFASDWANEYGWLLYQTLQSTVLTLLIFTLIVYVLGQATGGDGEPMDALVLAAWGLVPALVARSGFLVLEFGPVGGTEATPATNIAVVITAGAIACIWIGYCWRDGFRHAFGLERAVATPAAALGVCLCAVWFFWPWLV
ncbi:hypothetical protein G6M89_19145 [Natronolimnobius sp. AArcel1]|uniref:YIP1 family protein n=1 Tax=Natronolimnobius sp. AArcel1 TaxID=1679093 RepID=UPI0013EE28C2|nr:YIP1 family protein [Natronolimnobius sp. AArcel1]NGM71093.1 hypothetical protein [Natronolimnobius sp. AArcel1]